MDFSLTDEQRIIQQTARTLFEKECTLELVKNAWEDPHAAAPLWQDHLVDWLELSAQPLTDITLFMQEYGRALVPGVYFSSLLAAYAASSIDEQLAGSATVAVAASNGYWIPNEELAKHFVPCAAQVEQIVVINGNAENPRVAVVASDMLPTEQVDQMDRLRPLYRVDVHGGGQHISPNSWQHVLHRALVTVSAELIGVGRFLLDSALAYAKEREQFGRPIGSFQGLQWKLVDVALELERASAAVSWAAMCVDAGIPEAPHAVHSAKLEAGSAARHCARTSLQVHGGIGYTWEHGLHFWLRRAYAGDALMGSLEYHGRCLANLLFQD